MYPDFIFKNTFSSRNCKFTWFLIELMTSLVTTLDHVRMYVTDTYFTNNRNVFQDWGDAMKRTLSQLDDVKIKYKDTESLDSRVSKIKYWNDVTNALGAYCHCEYISNEIIKNTKK